MGKNRERLRQHQQLSSIESTDERERKRGAAAAAEAEAAGGGFPKQLAAISTDPIKINEREEPSRRPAHRSLSLSLSLPAGIYSLVVAILVSIIMQFVRERSNTNFFLVANNNHPFFVELFENRDIL